MFVARLTVDDEGGAHCDANQGHLAAPAQRVGVVQLVGSVCRPPARRHLDRRLLAVFGTRLRLRLDDKAPLQHQQVGDQHNGVAGTGGRGRVVEELQEGRSLRILQGVARNQLPAGGARRRGRIFRRAAGLFRRSGKFQTNHTSIRLNCEATPLWEVRRPVIDLNPQDGVD